MARNDPTTHLDRQSIRLAYRQEEEECVAERLAQARPVAAPHDEAQALAITLVEGARRQKASGLDAFLHQFGLATEEGIALMCLAEALLRVPDSRTADALIRDKIGDIDWSEHVGESSSTFVNAATFSLMLTGEVLERPEEQQRGMARTFKRTMNRLGEPVIRTATLQAMRILGGQFVFGRTMNEALKRAAPERARGLTHSFDMLGEAAMTFADADRYRVAYEGAIERLAKEAGAGVHGSPGISVKLSALYPKYDFFHREAAIEALVPILRDLAGKARDADIHFTVDAEEAERLEPSLDILEALVADDTLFANGTATGWTGFGLAIQAYQKRAVPLCDWTAKLARRHGRQLFVRLVKGAYWDTEIKLSQVGGFKDFPVFTRKVGTDVCYLACAEKRLMAAGERDASGVRHAQRLHDRRDQGAWRRATGAMAATNSSGCTAWARTCTARWPKHGGQCKRTRGADLCAGGERTRTCSPIWCGACWRTAPIPARSSTAWRMPACRHADSGHRSGGRASRRSSR